jgi:imidazoleglycerol-phosphate dehydratase
MDNILRSGSFERTTSETSISVKLALGSSAISVISSGVPFFDHMLSAFSRHGRFALELECKGDTHIDDHHSVEDCGICIGTALQRALGDKAGINRFGFASVPMDETLAQVSIDLSGRAYFVYSGPELEGYISAYNAELTREFLYALAMNCGCNLHVQVVYGSNRHHIHEAIFKALGVALRQAVERSRGFDAVPSTKGVLA